MYNMIQRMSVFFFCAVFASVFVLPVSTQAQQDFFGTLQQNLPPSTNTQGEITPQQGTSEKVVTTSTPIVDVSSSYQAYDAGQDQMSGYIAGGAAILAVLAVAFALGFVLTHHHSSSEENSQH